jgi:hypothetical protein
MAAPGAHHAIVLARAQCTPQSAREIQYGVALRNLGGKSNGYSIRSRALRPSRPGIPLHAPAGDADKLNAVIALELQTLRLHVRALTATNSNLRKRIKNLESQHASKAADPEVTPRRTST